MQNKYTITGTTNGELFGFNLDLAENRIFVASPSFQSFAGKISILDWDPSTTSAAWLEPPFPIDWYISPIASSGTNAYGRTALSASWDGESVFFSHAQSSFLPAVWNLGPSGAWQEEEHRVGTNPNSPLLALSESGKNATAVMNSEIYTRDSTTGAWLLSDNLPSNPSSIAVSDSLSVAGIYSSQEIYRSDVKDVQFVSGLGYSVALTADGNRLVTGGPLEPSGDGSLLEAGKAAVFDWNSTTGVWDQVGQDLFGRADTDFFGTTVQISEAGDRIYVGAPRGRPRTPVKTVVTGCQPGGYVDVYDLDDISRGWILVETLTTDLSDVGDCFGASLSLHEGSHDRLAVGAPQSAGVGSGYAKIYDLGVIAKFMICSTSRSRYIVTGGSVSWTEDYFLPHDGARANGVRVASLEGAMTLPSERSLKIRRVRTNDEASEIFYVEICFLRPSDDTYVQAYYSVNGGLEDPTQTNPVVMSFDTSQTSWDYLPPCQIDNEDCSAIALQLAT